MTKWKSSSWLFTKVKGKKSATNKVHSQHIKALCHSLNLKLGWSHASPPTPSHSRSWLIFVWNLRDTKLISWTSRISFNGTWPTPACVTWGWSCGLLGTWRMSLWFRLYKFSFSVSIRKERGPTFATQDPFSQGALGLVDWSLVQTGSSIRSIGNDVACLS